MGRVSMRYPFLFYTKKQVFHLACYIMCHYFLPQLVTSCVPLQMIELFCKGIVTLLS